MPPREPGAARPATAPDRRRRAVKGLLVVAFYAVLAGAFFHPTLLDHKTFSTVGAVERVYFPWQITNENGLPFFPQSDQAQTFYPRQAFIDRAVDDGKLPSWDPYTFAGHPYLSNGGNSFFYPPRLLVTLVAGPALAHDLFLLLHMALGGCAMYFLCRVLRVSTAGSLLAGVAWMWNPFFLSWFQLELVPAVMVWLPVALALVHVAHHRRSRPALVGAGVAAGMMLLGASLDLATAAVGCVGAYAAALEARRLWVERRAAGLARPLLRGVLPRLAALGALAVGTGAVAYVPFALLSRRFARTPIDYETFSTGVTLPYDTFLRFWWHPPYPFTDTTMHRMAFVGTVVAVLAVVGLLTRRAGWGLAVGLLGGSVLVLGRTPLVPVLDRLSASYRFLNLGRFMYAWALGLVVLAAIGFDRVAGWILSVRPGADFEPIPQLAALRWSRPSGRQLGAIGLFGVALVATGYQLHHYDRLINADFTPRTSAYLFPSTPAIDVVRALGRAPGGDRNLPIMRPGLQPLPDSSIPMVFPFESGAGYDSSLPSWIADLWQVVGGTDPAVASQHQLHSGLNALFMTDRVRTDLLPRVGITSVLAPHDLAEAPGWADGDLAARGLSPLYEGDDAHVLRVESAAPRAFVVHASQVERDQADGLARFTDPAFPWRSTVLLAAGSGGTDPAATAGAPNDLEPAEVLTHDLATVTVRAHSTGAGWLVLLDSYDDGWSATVDGHPVSVRRADAAFRAVPVPGGDSVVRFTYRTPGLAVGAAMSAFAVLSASAVALEPEVRRRVGRRRQRAGGSA